MTTRIAGLLALAFALALVPRAASACSALVCNGPKPAFAEGARIPANATALAFEPIWSGGEMTATEGRLVQLDGGAELAVEVEPGLVLLPEPLSTGSYELELIGDCEGEPVSVVVAFEVTEAAGLPEALGAASAGALQSGTVPTPTVDGSCHADIEAAYVDVEVELDPAAAPWADLLLWSTLVDGNVYAPSPTLSPGNLWGMPDGYASRPGASWIGAGRDRIFTTCDGSAGVEPGLHEVVFEARLPGTDVVLETAPMQVELACGGEPDPSEPTSEGSSGCSVGSAGAGSHAALALPLLALITFARRRRS